MKRGNQHSSSTTELQLGYAYSVYPDLNKYQLQTIYNFTNSLSLSRQSQQCILYIENLDISNTQLVFTKHNCCTHCAAENSLTSDKLNMLSKVSFTYKNLRRTLFCYSDLTIKYSRRPARSDPIRFQSDHCTLPVAASRSESPKCLLV